MGYGVLIKVTGYRKFFIGCFFRPQFPVLKFLRFFFSAKRINGPCWLGKYRNRKSG